MSSTLRACSSWALNGAVVSEGGRSVDLTFADGVAFRVRAAWLRDSLPSNVAMDWNRASVAGMSYLRQVHLGSVLLEPTTSQLRCVWKGVGPDGEALADDVVEPRWLRAFAPTVGKALNARAEEIVATVRPGDSAIEDLEARAQPWTAEQLDIQYMDAEELLRDPAKNLECLQLLVDPGMVMITHMPQHDPADPGKVVRDFMKQILGRVNVHPTRTTDNFTIASDESKNLSRDYIVTKKLAMHTDQAGYSSAGYVGWMHQYAGNSVGRVCDGLALSEEMRRKHPEQWRLLTEVQVYHGHRHRGYDRSGSPCELDGPPENSAEFELSHAHPILRVDADGRLLQVVHSEHKRATLDIPYDVFEPFLDAYSLFCELAESPAFVKEYPWATGDLVLQNNHRILHGRAAAEPGRLRAITGGKHPRFQLENRCRLLAMNQLRGGAEGSGLDEKWLIRVPNSILKRI